MTADLLAGARWSCCGTAPGMLSDPKQLAAHEGPWLAATVPGTVAGALGAAGDWSMAPAALDSWDWWYRCTFAAPAPGPGPYELELGGLATVADVWVNGTAVLHSENMFVRRRVALEGLRGDDTNELVLRFAALAPLLDQRRPRPRWKTMGASHQGLRWYRTTLLGRQPGYVVVPPPVGPWRPVVLRPAPPVAVSSRRVRTRCQGDDGVVELELGLRWRGTPPTTASLRVGPSSAQLDVEVVGAEGEAVDLLVHGSLLVADVERWWPHTHGPQPRYPAVVEAEGRRVELGFVGFRTIELDRAGDGFCFIVNGERVFCRGACWWPVDPVSLAASDLELRRTLELARRAHMNMIRIPGGTVYEDIRFWDLCDELGIMVWQDCMLGYLDPPDDERFTAEVVAELDLVLGELGGRPSPAIVCGGQEIEEQAAFFGLAREQWRFPLVEDAVPELVEQVLPGIPYITSSPTGGALPFEADAGDCHYWGVGSLLRDPDDARRCGIRFMSEGLGLGTPPDRHTVDEAFGGAMGAGHDPEWKRAVHHDTGRSWDLDDIRDFYAARIFEVDPHLLRYLDPERALDLGRATNAELVTRVLSEWRRAGSSCSGAVLVALRDLVPGPGWGVVDARSRPKATWFALRRLFAPVAVLVTDEGINGLRFHVVNDGPDPLTGTLRLALYAPGAARAEEAQVTLSVPPRASVAVSSSAVIDGFRDVGYAYRYGATGFDAVVASLVGADGEVVGEVVHLPMGQKRPLEADVGLQASVTRGTGGRWSLAVTTSRLAQWVEVDVPGFLPEDSWFHLVPGRVRHLSLEPLAADDGGELTGRVRALNSQAWAAIEVEG